MRRNFVVFEEGEVARIVKFQRVFLSKNMLLHTKNTKFGLFSYHFTIFTPLLFNHVKIYTFLYINIKTQNFLVKWCVRYFLKIFRRFITNMDDFQIKSLYEYGYYDGGHNSDYYITSDDGTIVHSGKEVKAYEHSGSKYVCLKTLDRRWKTVCLSTLMKEVFR
jgi:hypothetical protein